MEDGWQNRVLPQNLNVQLPQDVQLNWPYLALEVMTEGQHQTSHSGHVLVYKLVITERQHQ